MKFLIILLFLFSTFTVWAGDTWVKGYTKKNGTQVQGHYRSKPDGNPYNNYSTKGNVNPYTGKKGSKDPYSSGSSYNSGFGSKKSDSNSWDSDY